MPEHIAAVGIGCRFPGSANSPSRLWEVLRQPPDLTSEPPATRFFHDGFFDPSASARGTSDAPSSCFLNEDIGLFDTQFFKVTPKEAKAIDPKQRLLLETVYEAMENAGMTIQKWKAPPLLSTWD